MDSMTKQLPKGAVPTMPTVTEGLPEALGNAKTVGICRKLFKDSTQATKVISLDLRQRAARNIIDIKGRLSRGLLSLYDPGKVNNPTLGARFTVAPGHSYGS